MKTDLPAPLTSYDLDAQFRIVSVDDGWVDCAVGADATHLLPPGVLGISVMDAITDTGTRQLYKELFRRARHTGDSMSVPFRCDTPEERRVLRLTARPLGDGYRITTTYMSGDDRAPMRWLDIHVPRDARTWVKICSWCKRVDVGGEWLEVEAAIAALHLFDDVAFPELSHGICARCSEEMFALVMA